MTHTISYMVCSTPRSGSSLLCELLQNTELAGCPEEYFLPSNEALWQRAWQTDTYQDYLAAVSERGTTVNGVFGTKMMWRDLYPFLAKARKAFVHETKTDVDLLNTVFPNLRYIWIQRRDKVRQAVSHAKARQTNVWAVRGDLSPQPAAKAIFSYEQIDFMVHEIEAQDVAWQRFFTQQHIKPLVITYEDFAGRSQEAVLEVLTYLGVAIPSRVAIAPAHLKKQADEESEQWIQRYYHLRAKKRYRLLSTTNSVLLKCLQTIKQ